MLLSPTLPNLALFAAKIGLAVCSGITTAKRPEHGSHFSRYSRIKEGLNTECTTQIAAFPLDPHSALRCQTLSLASIQLLHQHFPLVTQFLYSTVMRHRSLYGTNDHHLLKPAIEFTTAIRSFGTISTFPLCSKLTVISRLLANIFKQ